MKTSLLNEILVVRAARLIAGTPNSVVFVTSLLRAREIKIASALRRIGWKVVLIYLQTTPFKPEDHFEIAIRARSEDAAHEYAKAVGPRLCHVFSGAVDGLVLRFCRDKPSPVVIDLNDIFCPSLFDYCHERFEPTRECLEKATALCARDLQAKRAQKLDGFKLPAHVLLFPEYSSLDGTRLPGAALGRDPDEVRVVSVGTFCLETLGMYDSCYLKLAETLTSQRIHLHIYPHWFYRNDNGSSFNWDLKKDFADFLRLQERTPYMHVHESLALDELARALPQYDFGIVAGGNADFGQKLQLLKPAYMQSCYSGRISDYLDARLPVLLNPEVAFNDWLLKRYGLAVDLTAVLRPGFRESLVAIKHDRSRAAAVEAAAQKLSLDRNITRLATFYEQISAESKQFRWNTGLRFWVAKKLPIIGRPLRELEEGARLLNQSKEEHERAKLMLHRLQNRRAAVENREQLLQRFVERSRERDGLQYFGLEDVHLRLEAGHGTQWADEVSGLLNWPAIREDSEQVNGMPGLLEMMRLFVAGSGPLSRVSSCWDVLNFKSFNQLLRDGYRNFKRTVGCHYFNFLVQSGDPQIAYLESSLTPAQCERCRDAAAAMADDPEFDWHDQKSYRYFVLLLWTYVRDMDPHRYLDRLEEPREGNPLLIPFDGRLASQDLANSVLEYYSMSEVVDFERCSRVLEIGGGYGRDAYVVAKLNPHLQYILVDIPPALWIAQRYFSSIFKDRIIFPVRRFERYAEVQKEMEAASIVFLLPHQLALLPECHVDFCLNISSFGEMQPEQIQAYTQAIDRVSRGYFYTKQWQVSQNAFDQLRLTEDDYPVPAHWRKEFSRPCRVQTTFFESMFRVKPSASVARGGVTSLEHCG